MTKSKNYTEKKRKASFIIGFLFIILGTTTQSDTSWLFTFAGLLALSQGLFVRYKLKHQKGE